MKHSPMWWLVRVAFLALIALGIWWTHGGKRDYRTHPLTDEEIEGIELMRSR